MLLIPCPFCGPREESEFACGGEAGPPRPADPDRLTDAAWTAWLWQRRNVKGVQVERWWHSFGCGRWFLAARDTASDAIVGTWPIGADGPEPDGRR